MILVAATAGGCASGNKKTDQLNQGYDALAQRQYAQAIAAADAYLASSPPDQRGVAEALYLKGRALEDRLSSTPTPPDRVAAEWQQARTLYVEALAHNPPQPLEAHVRAGIANVAFYQDDYQTAADQWRTALPHLDRPDVQQWVMYKLGHAEQRLGQFEAADQTFALVQQRFPDQPAAAKARERQGARQFVVQLATFSSAAGADRASAALRQQGVQPIRLADAQGRQVIRVGPVTTYAQARSLRQRFAGTYPDALILP